jgi:long-subunit fatty acid transport protein
VPAFNVTRYTNWSDTWAWCVGAELKCWALKCSVGYYQDETPQPLADVGPGCPDADRQGYTIGLGIPLGGGGWTLDVGYIYVAVDDRKTTLRPPTVSRAVGDDRPASWRSICGMTDGPG